MHGEVFREQKKKEYAVFRTCSSSLRLPHVNVQEYCAGHCGQSVLCTGFAALNAARLIRGAISLFYTREYDGYETAFSIVQGKR
jgi:hypothetical protein